MIVLNKEESERLLYCLNHPDEDMLKLRDAFLKSCGEIKITNNPDGSFIVEVPELKLDFLKNL